MIINPYVFGGAQFELRKFSVKYNLADPTYLTSAPFSDSGTIAAAAKVISFETIAPDGVGNANAVAGCAYMPDDVNGDRIATFEIDADIISVFPAGNMVEAARLFTITDGNQGITYDPINQYMHVYSEVGTITVKDLSGNVITTYTAPTYSSAVMIYYDYNNPGTWYAAKEPTSAALPVERWILSGSVVSVAETYWYTGYDGICMSNVFDRLMNFDDSGPRARIRYQTLDGRSGIIIGANPLTYVTEGIVEYPDGTTGACNPAGYNLHGSVVGGNRWMHLDHPDGVYLKYERSPSMSRFSKYKNGVVTGDFAKQVITGNNLLTCVYDFGANTNQQNLSAWLAEVEDGATYSLEFRGSATAPSTSPSTAIDGIPTYDANGASDGWGSASPGAWQGTPTSDRYMQCRITMSSTTPPATITIQDLIDGLGADLKLLVMEYDDDKMYVYPDTTGPTFQMPVMVNQVNTANNLVQITASQRLSYNTAGSYTDDNSNNSNQTLQTPSAIISDQVGQITQVGRREGTTTQAIYLAVSIHNTNTHRIVCGHKASSGTPASEIFIEHWDGTAAVVNRVGIADTSTTYKRIDFISTGSAWQIWLDRINQTLNVSVGSNNGNWFGDLTSPTRVATGICLGTANITGRHRGRLLIYGSTNWDSTQNNLIDAFIAQENLLA